MVGTVYDPSDGTGETWQVGLPPWPDVLVVVELLALLARGLEPGVVLLHAAAGPGGELAGVLLADASGPVGAEEALPAQVLASLALPSVR